MNPNAVQSDAADDLDPVEIDWLGHKVTIPATLDDADINFTRAMSRGDIVAALEALLGARQFAAVERAHRAKHDGTFRNRDLKPLGDQIADLYGFDTAGN